MIILLIMQFYDLLVYRIIVQLINTFKGNVFVDTNFDLKICEMLIHIIFLAIMTFKGVLLLLFWLIRQGKSLK